MEIFVTGATGVIGSEVVARLLAAGIRVRVLTRGQQIPGVGRDAHVVGDLRRPQLGLSVVQYQRLAGSIHRILHIGGIVDFAAEPGAIVNTNMAGAAAMVNLAHRAGADIAYVSTAYTHQILPGMRVSGTGCCTGRDIYLASKTAGDHLVAGSGLAYRILKPSILIGDSRTGAITRMQGLHIFLDAYRRARLPFFPCSASSRVDFVPVDIVADAIVTAVTDPAPLDNTTQWLTAGAAAPNAEQLKSWVDSAMPSATKQDVRYLPVDTVQRLILPAFLSSLSMGQRVRMENLLALAALFTEEPMPSTLAGSAGPIGLDKDILERSITVAVGRMSAPARARSSA